MKCPHCPRPAEPCRGESVPRLCQLVDPTRADHNPAYLAALDPRPSPPQDRRPAPPHGCCPSVD